MAGVSIYSTPLSFMERKHTQLTLSQYRIMFLPTNCDKSEDFFGNALENQSSSNILEQIYKPVKIEKLLT